MDANDQSMLFFSSRTHAKWCNILCIYALLCFVSLVFSSLWYGVAGRSNLDYLEEAERKQSIRNCNGKEVPKFGVYGNRGWSKNAIGKLAHHRRCLRRNEGWACPRSPFWTAGGLSGCFLLVLCFFYFIYSFIFMFSSCSWCSLPCTNLQSFYLFINIFH